MKVNIANTSGTEIVDLCKLLGLRINNPKNIFNSQLTIERDGRFYHAGSIEFPVMTLNIDEIKAI